MGLGAFHEVFEYAEEFEQGGFASDRFWPCGKYSAHIGNADCCEVGHSGGFSGLL